MITVNDQITEMCHISYITLQPLVRRTMEYNGSEGYGGGGGPEIMPSGKVL
jgi:hypothetical protein